ncbi:MAG: sensor histidine kinase [Actinomycetes bacterium]
MNRPKSRGVLRQVVAPSTHSGWTAFRRLQIVGVVIPILGLVALEALVLVLARNYTPSTAYDFITTLALGAITVLAVVGFSTMMFRYIKMAHEEVARQSAELAAVNAVSVAVRCEQGVDRILRAARAAVLDVEGVQEVSFVIFPAEDRASIDTGRTLVDTGMGSLGARQSEVVLATGNLTFGYMRVTSTDLKSGPPLGPESLGSIGQELTFALQSAQIIADLRRGEHENEVFNDILMQVSRQAKTVEILDMVAASARDLLNGDVATLSMSKEVVHSLASPGEAILPATFFAGPDSESDEIPAVGSDNVRTALVSLPIRGAEGILGELSVSRKSRVPFSVRDRGLLQALADISGSALTSAQLRAGLHRDAIVDERRRIAREMHDSLAQCLAFTHLGLRRLQARPEVGVSSYLPVELNRLADVCADAYRDVREAILGLNEMPGVGPTLIDSLSVYVRKYSDQSGVDTRLEVLLHDELDLSPYSELHLIRVVQEALTNVRKHSGATSAVVQITQQGSATVIEIKDNGVGFDPRSHKPGGDGFGLKTMRERLELLGGRLRISSSPGTGTAVRAEIPGTPHPQSLVDELTPVTTIRVG